MGAGPGRRAVAGGSVAGHGPVHGLHVAVRAAVRVAVKAGVSGWGRGVRRVFHRRGGLRELDGGDAA
jgi:hypothetical protein